MDAESDAFNVWKNGDTDSQSTTSSDDDSEDDQWSEDDSDYSIGDNDTDDVEEFSDEESGLPMSFLFGKS